MVSVAILFVVFLAGVKAFETLPEFGSPVFTKVADAPSVTYVEKGLAETGAANIVTAVILDYRGYDTLGEATVLFTSVLGALAILRSRTRKRLEEPDE